jgi:hypothetical protein
MAEVFFYTFRTNKLVTEIEETLGHKLYVIDKPAQDFNELFSAIESSGTEAIFGVGMSRGISRFESKAFNVYGKGLADKASDLKSIALSVPAQTSGIVVASGMTAGPCNYIAFKLAIHFPDKKNYFLHLKKEDIKKLQA